MLAGDHLKAAAELGIPLVGVGLLYRDGLLPAEHRRRGPPDRALRAGRSGGRGLLREGVTVDVELDGDTISANVWRKDVGTVPLYLLRPRGSPTRSTPATASTGSARSCCSASAACGRSKALGIDANVFHMNEGHSAFLAIERIRALVEHGLSTDDAIAQRQALDRLHDPHTRPGRQRDLRHRAGPPLRRAARDEAGLDESACSRSATSAKTEAFGLTPMSLRLSAYANGVSALHGEVAREMWSPLEDVDTEIGHVTNGVHLGTWLDPALAQLLRDDRRRPGRAARRRRWHEARDLDARALGRARTPRSCGSPS